MRHLALPLSPPAAPPAAAAAATLLAVVEGLTVAYRHGAGWRRAVEDVSLAVAQGECLGLVGESGSGKSTVALQLLGLRDLALRVEAGRVAVAGRDIVRLSRRTLDRLRGRVVGFVPQNPATALDPARRVGWQLAEARKAHGLPPDPDPGAAFARVGLPADAAFRRRFPHQLSGGQQQRVCIALALAAEPRLLVLDEPTTGLDVTTQAQIIRLLADLRARTGLAMLYVTHDLALLSHLADRVGVMYAGRLVEVAPTTDLFRTPCHPYTQGLLASLPEGPGGERFGVAPLRGALRRADLPLGCPFAPRCPHALPRCVEERQVLTPTEFGRSIACWRWPELVSAPPREATSMPAALHGGVVLQVEDLAVAYGSAPPAVRRVSFDLRRGETVALVGESGSGKSTIARAVAGLVPPAAGRVLLDGRPLAPLAAQRPREDLRRVQLVFQNPDASLNPRVTVSTSLSRALVAFGGEAVAIPDALAEVRLDPSHAARFPDQLSGGERQRVAIARALLARPDLLICDEVLSALDVSVQAGVLETLGTLVRDRGLAMLFITHDLAVVRAAADQVVVLFGGEIMEAGPAARVLSPPFHPYTAALVDAAPVPLRLSRAEPPPPRVLGTRPACPFATRCPMFLGPVCVTEAPPVRKLDDGHVLRCHLPLDALPRQASSTPLVMP